MESASRLELMALEEPTSDVWRAVHELGSAKGLDAGGFGRLRLWTAERMRFQRFAVFGRGKVRPSFRVALRHAADEIKAGRVPE